MKLGASVWPFQWNPPYEDAIRRIAGLGYQNLELIAWSPTALQEYYTPARIRDLKALMGDLGVSLSEFVTTSGRMLSADPAERQASIDHFKRCCEVAVEFGTDTINTVCPVPFALPVPPLKRLPTAQIWTVDVPEGLDWEQSWTDFVSAIQEIVSFAEGAGLRYAMEPHPYRYVASIDGMLRLADHVPSAAMGFNYDPSHTFPCGDLPNIAIYRLGSRVFHCHFSDNDACTNAHWRPGMGKIDWRGLLKALHDVGFDGTISIELEDVPQVANATTAAGPLFDEEMRLSREYLLEVSEGLGIDWD